MKRKMLILLTAFGAALGVSLFNTGSATALGGEWLGCRIAPGSEFNFYQSCYNDQAAASYTAAFRVQNESASSTYTWSIPSTYAVYGGCASNQNWCTLSVSRGSKIDQEITVSVTLTQGGSSATLTSTAFIRKYCYDANIGSYLC
jgi:hypothetical protein